MLKRIAEVLQSQPNLSIEVHPEDGELDQMFSDRDFHEFYGRVKAALVRDLSDVIIVGPEFCGKSIVLAKLRYELQVERVNYIVYINASSVCTFNFIVRELQLCLRRSDILFSAEEKEEIAKLVVTDQHSITGGEFVQILSRCIDNVLLNHGFKRIVLIIDELDDLFTKDPAGVTKLFLDLGHVFAEPRYQIICDCLPKMKEALIRAGISPDVRIINMPRMGEQTLCDIVLNRIQSVITAEDKALLHRTYPFSYSAISCIAKKARGNLGVALAIADQAILANGDKSVIEVRDIKMAAAQPEISRILEIVKRGTRFTLLERIQQNLFAFALCLLLVGTIAGFAVIMWKRHAIVADKAWAILGSLLGAFISGLVVLVALKLRKDQ